MAGSTRRRVRRSYWAYLGPVVLSSVLGVFGLFYLLPVGAVGVGLGVLLLAGLVFGMVAIQVRFGADWTLTTDRLSQRLGIISRQTSEIELGDVRNVQLRQGVVDRIVGIGAVLVSTAGQSGFEIIVSGIRDPEEFAEAVRRGRRAPDDRSS